MRVWLGYGDDVPNPCLTGEDGEVEDYSVIVEENMAVNESSFTPVTLYPNPVKDIAHFSAKEKIEEITIFNAAGQQMFTSRQHSFNAQVNLSGFSKGLYVAKIKTAAGVQTVKLIKE